MEANIQNAVCDVRSFEEKEESIPQLVRLLNITNFTPTIDAVDSKAYYRRRRLWRRSSWTTKSKLKLNKKAQAMIDLAQETGQQDILVSLRKKFTPPERSPLPLSALSHL